MLSYGVRFYSFQHTTLRHTCLKINYGDYYEKRAQNALLSLQLYIVCFTSSPRSSLSFRPSSPDKRHAAKETSCSSTSQRHRGKREERMGLGKQNINQSLKTNNRNQAKAYSHGSSRLFHIKLLCLTDSGTAPLSPARDFKFYLLIPLQKVAFKLDISASSGANSESAG